MYCQGVSSGKDDRYQFVAAEIASAWSIVDNKCDVPHFGFCLALASHKRSQLKLYVPRSADWAAWAFHVIKYLIHGSRKVVGSADR
jgi:hypothetical protein